MRRTTLSALSTFVMVTVSCTRPQLTVTPIQPLRHTESSALTVDASVARHDDTSTPSPAVTSALPPLFARKIDCLRAGSPRGFARHTRTASGVVRSELTADELRARPWLWGQYPSGCAGIGIFARAPDGGIIDPYPALGATTRERILAVADRYLSWGRVDDYQRWAPFDCMMPPSGRVLPSLEANAPHGRKVYFLYALQRVDYLEHRDSPQQIVVKEAWAPHVVPRSEAISSSYPPMCAEDNGDTCTQPGAFNGLFIMMRGASTPETDDGWTYATVDPAGEITASGRIASCMNCHRRAPHGRLFGITTGAAVRWRP